MSLYLNYFLLLCFMLPVFIKSECIDHGVYYFCNERCYNLNSYYCTYMPTEEVIYDINDHARYGKLDVNILNSNLSLLQSSFSNEVYGNAINLSISQSKLDFPKEMFKSFRHLNSLSLYENSIKTFQGNYLGNPNKEFILLNLTKNNIETIYSICEGLSSLRTLILKDNKLTDLEESVFEKCTNIRVIDLSYNKLKNMSSFMFATLDTLNELDISQNYILELNTLIFKFVPNLRFLNLSTNNIMELKNNYNPETHLSFRIEKLDLFNNNISLLNQESYKHFGYLQELNLSNNTKLSLRPNVFKALDQLKQLYISNSLRDLKVGMFIGLSALVELDLSDGNISSIEPLSFEGLDKLRVLNLQKNSINSLKNDNFIGLKKLSTLYINNNNIEQIESGAFNGLFNMQTLDLRNNSITLLPSYTFNQATNLKNLYLGSNPLKDIERRAFFRLLDIDNTLDIYNNSIFEGKLIENIFQGINQLHSLDLTDLNIEKIDQGALNGLTHLKVLNISRNKLQNIPCNASRLNLEHLTFLSFAFNRINNISICAFKIFPNLEHLLLNNNELSFLKVGTLSPLTKLNTLNISYNQFKYLDDKVTYPLVQLVELDVSGNTLFNFDSNALTSHLAYLRYIGLSGNPWICHNLTAILKSLTSRGIDCTPRVMPMYDEDNVNGIGCVNSFDIGDTKMNSVKDDSPEMRNNNGVFQKFMEKMGNILRPMIQINRTNDFVSENLKDSKFQHRDLNTFIDSMKVQINYQNQSNFYNPAFMLYSNKVPSNQNYAKNTLDITKQDFENNLLNETEISNKFIPLRDNSREMKIFEYLSSTNTIINISLVIITVYISFKCVLYLIRHIYPKMRPQKKNAKSISNNTNIELLNSEIP